MRSKGITAIRDREGAGASPWGSVRKKMGPLSRSAAIVAVVAFVAALVFVSFAGVVAASPATPGLERYTGVVLHPQGLPYTAPAIKSAPHSHPAASASVPLQISGTGDITGRVTNSSGSAGLAGIEVDAYTSGWELAGAAYTDAGGYYELSDVANVPVWVVTYNETGYIDEYYNNIPAPGNPDATGATALDLAAVPTRTGINFALATGRSISGKVTNAGGTGLANVLVEAYGLDGTYYVSAVTAAGGTYTIKGLPSGTYYVATLNDVGYIDEWYNNVVFVTHPEATGATSVNITSANASGINFALAAGKTISGTVTNGSSGIDVYVDAWDLSGNFCGEAETDPATGAYSIIGLPAQQYRIATSNSDGYVDEWYNNDPVLLDIQGTSATLVNVTSGNVTGRNFQLDMGKEISGEVTATTGGAALADIQIRLQLHGQSWQLYMSTDSTGAYTFSGLPAGQYYVNTANGHGYIDEWYNNDPVPGDVFGEDATAIDLTSASNNLIDFSLDNGYSIAGTVTDALTSGALAAPGMLVMIYNGAGDLCADSLVGGTAGTSYSTWALPGSTTYYARVRDYAYGDYAEEWYNNLKCSQNDFASATAIPVGSANVTGITFALDKTNYYEQDDQHITYDGAWTTYSAPSAHGGSYSRLTASGSSATIYFRGIRLDWIAMKGTTTGAAKVYVDDSLTPVNIDLTASAATYQLKVFSTGDLARGLHKVKIVWNATAGKFVTIDGIRVDGTIAEAPPTITGISPSAGSIDGGTTVTISGAGLADVTSVTFDGLPATGASVNSAGTRITATTPAHAAGAVTVTVTAPSGTATTSYTYQVMPAINRYDQTNPYIVRNGTWANFTSTPSYDGSYGRSATSGASVTIWFTGTQLDYIAMKGKTTGYADIWVDNVKVTGSTPVNLTASVAVYQQNVWTTGPLASGLHSVRIVRSASSASGKFLTLDAVDIAGTITAPPTRYQQTDTHIVKSGVWTNFSSASASGTSYGRSLTSGAYATITFNGTRFDWIAMKGTTTGYADVWLDGVKVTSTPIDLTALAPTYQVTVWSSGTLSGGVHTVRIVRNDLLSGTTKYVTLDAVDIWGAIQ